MRPTWIVMMMLAVAVASPVAARAHDGHVHRIMGTVTARDAKHLAVKTPSGEVLSIAITDKTTALRNKKKVDLKEVQIGRRVVVDIGNGEDPLKAGEIHVGATTLAAASPDEH
jgi:stress response protein YsnF